MTNAHLRIQVSWWHRLIGSLLSPPLTSETHGHSGPQLVLAAGARKGGTEGTQQRVTLQPGGNPPPGPPSNARAGVVLMLGVMGIAGPHQHHGDAGQVVPRAGINGN